MKHRFVIGIGSQRAGSTLLHRLLEAASEVFMHPVKELHYFDTLYGLRSPEALKDFSLRQLARQVDRIVNAKDLGFATKRKYKCYLRTHKILAIASIKNVDYIDLFRPCLINSALIGEVTPEYMLFDETALEKMQAVIGEDAAIILICRNPVKRFLSAVKLMNSYNNLNLNDVTVQAWIQKMLTENTNWLYAQDQYNNYEATITRYTKYFRHFTAISYDDLVTFPEETAAHLTQTLNFRINTEVFKNEASKVVNELGGNFTINDATIQQLTARYQKEQAFLDDFFGKALTK